MLSFYSCLTLDEQVIHHAHHIALRNQGLTHLQSSSTCSKTVVTKETRHYSPLREIDIAADGELHLVTLQDNIVAEIISFTTNFDFLL